MNERIKELAEQSTETYTAYFDGRGNVTSTVFNKEKFAELIIRECANQVSRKSESDSILEYFNL
jgi:outer membrane protein assembly factor BamE (lipoprotein component of BamABCDE complex)